MQPVLFYGVPEGCSFGSIVALEWLGVPYRLCRIRMPEQVSGEVFRAINPVGETPALLTSAGQLLAESMAILNHLGVLGIDKGLAYPQGSRGFDRLNAMLAFLNTSFFNAFSPLWHALEHGAEGIEKDVLTRYGREKVAKAHADLEAMLRGREWLLGDERTLADAYFIGIARWAEVHDAIDRRQFPGLDRLFRRLQEDPAVRFAQAIEHGERAQGGGGFAGHVGLDDALRLVGHEA
ncbi:MAG TPA: glutathione S-transferase family protein [Geminicoccus sp.]|jgi:glutathione S-transferase|uniref:glutathione S-transferase family protein n=1 Tax=Geminicoccus sp. TaxID=2024832 RepID=UPI002E358960|nr:glutathione S-transferase family protein [Geminicoccus sp.]HEX2526287.1 glutathione S-transferase family protein [Geminicoccus sp.]